MRSRPRFYRRPGCLVALGMLAAVAYGLSMLWDAVKPGCTTVILNRLPSPGGAWVAVDEESVCDVGFLAGSDVVVGIRLVTTKPPLRDIQVVGVDTGGYVDERPLVAWSASNVLRITVPLQSLLNILTRQAGGVRVDIHFDPMTSRRGRRGLSRPICHPIRQMTPRNDNLSVCNIRNTDPGYQLYQSGRVARTSRP